MIPGTRTPLPDDGMPSDGLMPLTEHLSKCGTEKFPLPNWDNDARRLIIPDLPDFLSDGITQVTNVCPPPPDEFSRFAKPDSEQSQL